MMTSCPEASWDFLVIDSSSASTRILSLRSASVFFSPKRTLLSKAVPKKNIAEVSKSLSCMLHIREFCYFQISLQNVLAHKDQHETVTCNLWLKSIHLCRKSWNLFFSFHKFFQGFCECCLKIQTNITLENNWKTKNYLITKTSRFHQDLSLQTTAVQLV